MVKLVNMLTIYMVIVYMETFISIMVIIYYSTFILKVGTSSLMSGKGQ